MGRALRSLPPGAIAHVTNRGAGGEHIFLTDRDRGVFLRVVAEQAQQREWACHAYCLMDNHFHLLLQAPAGDISAGMKLIGARYAFMFNRAHQRVGHLFQSRFGAVVVDDQAHALELARYIALNPVRAGIVDRPELWPWSSYHALHHDRWLFDSLRSDWFIRQFGGVDHLRRFVEAGL
jgi:putative transposase